MYKPGVNRLCQISFVGFALLCASAFGCSCYNGTPLQRNNARYANEAIFTAHVVKLVGKVSTVNGHRYSDKVLVRVTHEEWGLPWYWPHTLLLEGGYPCDIAMQEGDDLLVAGRESLYGILQVNLCSRTQSLKDAQVDLRTLDGSRCAGPGGTLIGRIESADGTTPFTNTTIALHGDGDQTYSTSSDADGIYEFRHLPAGTYRVEGRTAEGRAISAAVPPVVENTCTDGTVFLGKR